MSGAWRLDGQVSCWTDGHIVILNTSLSSLIAKCSLLAARACAELCKNVVHFNENSIDVTAVVRGVQRGVTHGAGDLEEMAASGNTGTSTERWRSLTQLTESLLKIVALHLFPRTYAPCHQKCM